MDSIQHRLTIQESPCTLGNPKRFEAEGSFSLYDAPCAIELKGNLEALIREFPLGNLTSEIIEAVSCKEKYPAPCDPLYVKTDELLVSEKALTLWKSFRQLLGNVKLLYLPSQLSELVRYNSDFDGADDHHCDYGDADIVQVEALLADDPDLVFEATLFRTDSPEVGEEVHNRFEQSLIAQRRRSPVVRGIVPAFAGREVYSNGAAVA